MLLKFWRWLQISRRRRYPNRNYNAVYNLSYYIWGVWCQRHLSRAGTSNYIPQYLWDVIMFHSPSYMLLTRHSSYNPNISHGNLSASPSHGRHGILTHWGRDKMDAISQTTFSSAFSWITRKIWGIWKLRPAYSPETLNFGQNRWCFVPCDLEIWWMTLENNRASLLSCFKLCATFHSHWWIQTGATVRKCPIWVKFDDF